MKLTQLQFAFAQEVVRSWSATRSNYIVVAPPMSGEREFTKVMCDRAFLHENLGGEYARYKVANIDAANFRDDMHFAKGVMQAWGAKLVDLIDEDASTILNASCGWVVQQGLIPVLIVQRFHEAIERLGENVGTALRNLEHDFLLKTVVTMPVRLLTLRERWEVSKSVVPFLASDWGQGHSVKLLPGYTLAELIKILQERGGLEEQAATILQATGGLRDLVDRLVDGVGNKKGRGLENFLRSRSSELCERLVRWMESPCGTHGYKKSLVNLVSSNLYSDQGGLISRHDWSPLILSKSGVLNFNMLAWASYQELSKSKDHTWVPRLLSLIEAKEFVIAKSLVDLSVDTEKNARYELWRVVGTALDLYGVGGKIFSSDVNWLDVQGQLEVLRASLLDLGMFKPSYDQCFNAWFGLFKMLDDFQLTLFSTPGLRFEEYVCNRIAVDDLHVVYHLWQARLFASKAYEPYQRALSIVTIPESVLQVYAYFKYGIKFWSFDGLDAAMEDGFKEFIKYDYALPKGRLGYHDLVHIIAFLAISDAGPQRLLDAAGISVALEQYKTRKELAHSTAFASIQGCESYHEFCDKLLEDTRHIYKGQPGDYSFDIFISIACDAIRAVDVTLRLE